ncbi:MAG TPA: PhoH family protein, partial [Chromatiaceae bacterium]|nr:PhoH family protein [Chromatiaceae bacterium]
MAWREGQGACGRCAGYSEIIEEGRRLRSDSRKRLFVLDTNVLMHDPTALFRFAEHDIFLPMVVLEEMDRGKKGMSEVARNVRQASRFLDDLVAGKKKSEIDQGLPIPSFASQEKKLTGTGKLYFQTRSMISQLPEHLPGNTPDNSILASAIALQEQMPEHRVTLISKDINLRIKAALVGVPTEDYSNDKVLDDVSLLYSGTRELPADFWDHHSKDIESWQESGHTYYRVSGPDTQDWYPNQCLYMEGEQPFEAVVRATEDDSALIETVQDYRTVKHAVWGIRARNREQNFAFNMLLDPEVDFVTLLGSAGTGKTLLTLAAGLAQVL